jgi:hypothetical protein
VFKSWEDLEKLDNVAEVRRQNIKALTKAQQAYYDGQTPMRETYDDWLRRQPLDVQAKHLGDYNKVTLFRTGQVKVDKFSNPEGNSVGIRELRAMTDSGYTVPGDTQKFANAKARLDAMQLGASTPEDFYRNKKMAATLVDYYLLQAGELDGTLSTTNYRGVTLAAKSAGKKRVLISPPREEQLIFNPLTGRYDDVRLYQPSPEAHKNAMRLVAESDKLSERDKSFIKDVDQKLSLKMGLNQRAAVVENLRATFGRFRESGEVWGNFKAVSVAQMKFDVMNVSDFIETTIRHDADVLKKLLSDSYIDPVLGPVQLDDLGANLFKNIKLKNKWEDNVAPKIARELKPLLHPELPIVLRDRLTDRDLQQFYLRFAHRLALNDGPDRDQVAVSLGRDLHNLANLNGNRNDWYNLGMKLLSSKRTKKFYDIETFGVQKKRMKSRLGNGYFGPYYDTQSFNIKVVDPRILEYSRTTRRVELGMRVGVTDPDNRLLFRKGSKTYWMDKGFGLEDTRIPITSTSSFADFPEEFIDGDMVNALSWAGKAEYRVDPDYYDFINRLLYFQDDRGAAKHYNEANEYRKFIASRGDAYERFKAMEWLRASGKSFSNTPFIDHRARVYERGLIGPQAGETFRPFLSTKEAKAFSPDAFKNYQDQVGSFLGGLNDYFEGRYNSLTVTGRQKIAEKWRPEMVRLGNAMLRGKPADIRMVLDSEMAQQVDGEELGKFYRFAIETAKFDNFLSTPLVGAYSEGGEYNRA